MAKGISPVVPLCLWMRFLLDSLISVSECHEDGSFVIEGGNHAQFGNYGPQEGDGTAGITAEEQQDETVRLILEWMERTEQK